MGIAQRRSRLKHSFFKTLAFVLYPTAKCCLWFRVISYNSTCPGLLLPSGISALPQPSRLSAQDSRQPSGTSGSLYLLCFSCTASTPPSNGRLLDD